MIQMSMRMNFLEASAAHRISAVDRMVRDPTLYVDFVLCLKSENTIQFVFQFSENIRFITFYIINNVQMGCFAPFVLATIEYMCMNGCLSRDLSLSRSSSLLST